MGNLFYKGIKIDKKDIDYDRYQLTEKEYNKNLVFLGDSTLDNLIWVIGKNACIASQLRQRSYNVVNYAADGFTTSDLLYGNVPSIDYQQRYQAGDPYPSGSDKFKPLDWVEKFENPSNSIFISSCGGNNIRENLKGIYIGYTSAERVLRKGAKEYITALERMLKSNKKIMICTQYKPSTIQNDYQIYKYFTKERMVEIMDLFYPILFEFARKHNLPILDFTRSLDPSNPKLFKCQIEPSKFGGRIIADMIDYASKNHDFNGKSKFYIKRGIDFDVEVEDNVEGYKWDISCWEFPLEGHSLK